MISNEPVFDTPMLKQYQAIKKDFKDAILFFRLGDFYEMFLDDAKIAAKELSLTLTGRGKEENRVPMCGIPYHAANNYIFKLTNHGYKVAICEQVEDPRLAKGITKREVVKIITPGTVLEQSALDDKENNFLLALFKPDKKNLFTGGFVDLTTGEFFCFQATDENQLLSQIDYVKAKEVLIPQGEKFPINKEILVNYYEPLNSNEAEKELKRFFNLPSLASFGITEFTDSYPALWAIITYLTQNQKNNLDHLKKIQPFNLNQIMFLDQVTRKNLELTESLFRKDHKATLFWVLDQTKTSMGARYLKNLLKNPLFNLEKILDTQKAVAELKDNFSLREEIRQILDSIPDFERLLSRIILEANNPKDLITLKNSLKNLSLLPKILEETKNSKSKKLACITKFFADFKQASSPFSQVINLIEKSIIESAPHSLKDGNFILETYSEELAELKASFKNIKEWIKTLEERERERTGIKSLKVGFNKVFGYYLEVYKNYFDRVPQDYIRKQTLVNQERFITPELKEKENILLNGEEQQKQLEIQIFQTIIKELKKFIEPIQQLCSMIAELDTLQSLATVAQKNNYVQPEFSDTPGLLEIEEGRHPVLERNPDVHFIPNDLKMDFNDNRFTLITGPNMAGKSTIMRQIALIVIMAQIGSFVPAKSLKMSLVDKLFTRIGALDNLYFGQSTFMVEMLETASIINNATEQSLIILDEIGRGTSTYDGMSIALAISDYIYNEIKARTLFATHYHEITILEKRFPGFKNYHMEIVENQNTLVFKYKFTPGSADKSYGVHVAEMAGLPFEIIKKAKEILTGFQEEGLSYLEAKKRVEQLSLF